MGLHNRPGYHPSGGDGVPIWSNWSLAQTRVAISEMLFKGPRFAPRLYRVARNNRGPEPGRGVRAAALHGSRKKRFWRSSQKRAAATLLDGMRFERHTETTVVDRSWLERTIETVRKEAVAYDEGEYNGVLYCVASPVIGRDGVAVGAIGVSMVKPIAVSAPEHIVHVAAEVRGAARAMTAALGGEEMARRIFPEGRLSLPEGQLVDDLCPREHGQANVIPPI